MSAELDVAKLRDQITDRLRVLGISAREASRRAGFNVGYVGDFLTGRSRALGLDRVSALAQALEMPTRELLGESHFDIPGNATMPASPPNGLLPLYAPRLNSSGPRAELPLRASSYVPCFPGLVGSVGAYAVRVWNDIAAPRYCMGETIYVSPGTKGAVGDWVFVLLEDRDGFIARLADKQKGKWIFDLGDPKATAIYTVDDHDIDQCLKIVASVA